MTFPDFYRQMEWCQSYFTKMSLNTYCIYRIYGYYVTHGYWCVGNFGYVTKLTFQCNFKSKTCLARYDHRYLMCEASSYTMTLYERKTVLTHTWHFLRTNKKSPLKIPLLGVQCIKLYDVYVSLRRYKMDMWK